MEPKLAQDRDGQFCPTRATLALVGQKWVPRIVYELRDGTHRFNDLATTVGGCNSRTLRDRLRALEEVGIVDRNEVATNPPWVEYALTPRGFELAEAIEQLGAWGQRHMTPEMLSGVTE